MAEQRRRNLPNTLSPPPLSPRFIGINFVQATSLPSTIVVDYSHGRDVLQTRVAAAVQTVRRSTAAVPLATPSL